VFDQNVLNDIRQGTNDAEYPPEDIGDAAISWGDDPGNVSEAEDPLLIISQPKT
jgi:hypothetical protein